MSEQEIANSLRSILIIMRGMGKLEHEVIAATSAIQRRLLMMNELEGKLLAEIEKISNILEGEIVGATGSDSHLAS